MTEAEYDQMMDIADEWESQLLGKGDTGLQHSITDGNTLDNSGNSNENSVTDDSKRGENYDNGRVREGAAEVAGHTGTDGKADTRTSGMAQEIQQWRSQSASVQRVVTNTVKTHINKSSNANEVFRALCSMVNRTEETISPYMYKKAVGILTERVFNDAISMHPVIFENRWSFLGRSITSLYRSIKEMVSTDKNVEERQYSISDTSSKQDVVSGLKDILRRGGDINELRQFVAQVEQDTASAKQNATRADQNTREAEHILESAKRQGISVEEYLSQNWELYETENGWDPAARKALDLEKGDSRQYSIKATAKMPYKTQLEQIEKGMMNGSNSLYIGTPSVELQNAGFSSNPFAMNQGDYRKSRRAAAKNKNYSSHAVPYDFFANMPEHLAQAPMLIDNGKKVTVITSYPMKDTKGQDSFVVSGVWRDNPMENDTVNQAKSVYAWDDIVARITRAAEEGRLVVINKNKAAEMLATIGVQPSEVSRILDLAKETLSQAEEDVKQFSVSDTQLETEGQEEFTDAPTTREQLPRKAQEYLKRAERKLLRDLAGVMNAHRFADRTYLQEVVQQISEEYRADTVIYTQCLLAARGL